MAYATVSDARAAGFPVTISDPTIQAELDTWSQFIDKACRQWFEPRTLTIDLDGVDSRVLHLPVPVISLTSLYMNADFTTVVPTTAYKLYTNCTAVRDDRRNPRIELASAGVDVWDYSRYASGSRFCIGTQNQRLVGSFGFVEADGSTPLLIKRAVLKLAARKLAGGTDIWNQVQEGIPAGGGLVQSETTDGHSISYAAFSYKPTVRGSNNITNDAEVDGIITMYKGPLLITSTKGSGGPDRRYGW